MSPRYQSLSSRVGAKLGVLRFFALLVGLPLLLGNPAAAAGGNWVKFANGKAEVQLPAKLQPRHESDGTLRAAVGPTANLEMTLLDHEQEPGRPNTAKNFIEYYAKQKQLPVRESGGKAVVMEGAETEVGGKPYRIARWQIGFGKSIVVMTLSAPVEATIPPALRDFMQQDLESVIQSIRRTAQN